MYTKVLKLAYRYIITCETKLQALLFLFHFANKCVYTFSYSKLQKICCFINIHLLKKVNLVLIKYHLIFLLFVSYIKYDNYVYNLYLTEILNFS